MIIGSYVSGGFDGDLVTVEVDLRRGIPGMDIVGLPDSAVRESRERVRAALRNSGYSVPRERILINLAPAGVKKAGASFDLPIAAAILETDRQIFGRPGKRILLMGELDLSGTVRAVKGVLPAVASAVKAGFDICIVPEENGCEADSVSGGRTVTISHLRELDEIFALVAQDKLEPLLLNQRRKVPPASSDENSGYDYADMIGQEHLKRACEIAAAGRHHMLIFGPPGVGKTMAAVRFIDLLPPLNRQESIEVTRIYSIGGMLAGETDLIRRPPMRSPHHTASREGLIGGGAQVMPGEISYAHRGVLFLDEALEFSLPLLQSLREPLERGMVEIARSGRHYWFPSRFQLILAANPCPCGKLGKPDTVCMCTPIEVHRYWKKIGAALLDRIDMRVPVEHQGPVLSKHDEKSFSTAYMVKRVSSAIEAQRRRYGADGKRNADMSTTDVRRFCRIESGGVEVLRNAVERLSLSTRAEYSVMKIARTVADLYGSPDVKTDHLLEAVYYRRFGEGDYFWSAA